MRAATRQKTARRVCCWRRRARVPTRSTQAQSTGAPYVPPRLSPPCSVTTRERRRRGPRCCQSDRRRSAVRRPGAWGPSDGREPVRNARSCATAPAACCKNEIARDSSSMRRWTRRDSRWRMTRRATAALPKRLRRWRTSRERGAALQECRGPVGTASRLRLQCPRYVQGCAQCHSRLVVMGGVAGGAPRLSEPLCAGTSTRARVLAQLHAWRRPPPGLGAATPAASPFELALAMPWAVWAVLGARARCKAMGQQCCTVRAACASSAWQGLMLMPLLHVGSNPRQPALARRPAKIPARRPAKIPARSSPTVGCERQLLQLRPKRGAP